MSQDLDRILEIKSHPHAVLDENGKRISHLAKASFYLGLSLVPPAIGSSLISEFVIYNPPLTAINGLLLYLIWGLTPVAVLLGIAALIRIPISKKKIGGCRLALIGIIVSLTSFVVSSYYLLDNMSWA
jgi:hypothetical protein